MWSIAIAALADLIFKDPPNRIHSTAWMGTLIGRLWGHKSPTSRCVAFIKGTLITLGVTLLFAGLAFFITNYLLVLIPLSLVRCLFEGLLLSLTFSFSKLIQEGKTICTQLNTGNPAAARKSLSYNLVSRDTTNLNEGDIIAAALESLAENLTDSLTAPLFFFLLFGLPGAFAYRVVNTCDALLGYHDTAREWLGKFPARLDDILNLIPARMTALIILTAGLFVSGKNHGLSVMFSDRSKTESPNAGWTMSALAGVLNVSFRKQGYYILNKTGPEPDMHAMEKGIQICRLAGIIILILFQGLDYGLLQ